MTHETPLTNKTLKLRREITLPGAIALVVGGVIGAGIFVMVRDIGAQTGRAIWMSFAAAILISLIGVIPVIQLAGALPRAGAGYLFASRLLSPYVGVLTSAWVLLGGACSTAVVARTMAQYLMDYLPSYFPHELTAVIILLFFYGVYAFGVRLAMSLQIIMAVQFLTALLIYGTAGTWFSGLAISVIPLKGWSGFLMSILLAYATCMGFQVVAEMGEEIRNARRTIPLALLIGGFIIAVVYIIVGLVFVNSIPYDPNVYDAMNAPLRMSAMSFLSPLWVHFLGLGVLTAGLTSLNAAALALPRELFALARDEIISPLLGRIDPKTGAPQHAVTAYFVLVVVLLLGSFPTDFYGYMAAIGILAISSVMGLASLRLLRRFPERYRTAYIQFPMPLLYVCATVTLFVSISFGIVIIVERPSVFLVYTMWTLVVSLYYGLRIKTFDNTDWQRLQEIPGEDEVVVS